MVRRPYMDTVDVREEIKYSVCFIRPPMRCGLFVCVGLLLHRG